MANAFDLGLHTATQLVRFGWFYGLNRLVDRQSRSAPAAPRKPVSGSVPSTTELLVDLVQLFLRDAEAVRVGLYPPDVGQNGFLENLHRAQAMLADVPSTMERRWAGEASTSRAVSQADGLPDYYLQDFHFQTGGYLTGESARLYDVQVETLFLGGAAAMRREALRPIAEFMRGRDQRRTTLLDVACGTGRFLRDVRLAWPAMRLMGLDLSQAYLDEGRRQVEGLRPVEWMVGAGERLPLPDASVDIATSIFLFHELPGEVRRKVSAEVARVLKSDGLFVFIDSLQLGDRPGWDGLLESFPMRFHEPYFAHYTSDDLDRVFAEAGLGVQATWTSYLSKIIVCRKR